MNKIKSFRFVLLCLILFSSCNFFTDKDDPIVAQVDKNILRLSDINKALGFLPEDQLKNDFIDMWVEKQLWYKEAQRYINNNSDIQNKIKEYEKSLFIEAYQQKYILDKISITEGEVRDYYEKYKGEFIAYNDAAYIQVFILNSLENAENLVENLKNSIHPNIPSEFKLVYRNDYIDEIDKLLFSSKTGKNIGPIELNGQYYVIVKIEKYSKNSPIAMEHVRTDIIQKLRAVAYVTAIDKKQNELKDQYNVKIIKNTDN